MRTGHSLITFFGGLYFVLFFLMPESVLESIGVLPLHGIITNGFIVVGTMACGIGLINLVSVHTRHVLSAKIREVFFSGVLLLGLGGTLGFGISDWVQEHAAARFFSVASAYATFFAEHREELSLPYKTALAALVASGESALRFCTVEMPACQKLRDTSRALAANTTGGDAAVLLKSISAQQSELLELRQKNSVAASAVRFFNEGVFIPLGSSMFSLLAFYIATAAFQAFRIRSFESALLMAAASLVIIGQTSVGSLWWSGFPAIRNWLMTVPNTAAFRGISIGASIAAFILAIRVWLSLDKANEV